MKKILFITIALSALFACNRMSNEEKEAARLSAKIDSLVKQMTLEEKISLIHGKTNFSIPAIERLGIPSVTMSDGPHGVREDLDEKSWAPKGGNDDYATYLPQLTSLAATWNLDLSRQFGEVIGREAKARNKRIMLGPGINIIRTPLGGRNFEYMSEDPYLISKMVVPLVKGMQSNGTIACVKHFALNNQEKGRYKVNVDTDDRTMHEIYFPGFEAALNEGGALAIMGAYNKVRGQYCCHNDFLLNQVLKKDWGFKGVVISDWGGTHSTLEAANNGLDIEMGTDAPFDSFYMAKPLLAEVQKGLVKESVIDDKVKRILYVILKTQKNWDAAKGELNSKQNQEIALNIAKEGIVLLKNQDQLLPINFEKVKSIALIGDNATQLHAYGGGSSMLKTPFEISPLEALRNKFGDKVQINVAQGYSIDKNNIKNYLPEAISAAKKSDLVLFIGGLNHHFDNEGWDKIDMKLPYNQDELINQILKVNPKTVVVLVCGTPVEVSRWIDQIPAVLQISYNGMNGGDALVSVLTGETNPSGKLPYTFPKKLNDSPAHVVGDYPGENNEQYYKEGFLVGYRWFDTKNIEPQFCFGHGLSYSKFEYSDLNVQVKNNDKEPQITVSLKLKNSSTVEGKEVVQLYIKDIQSTLQRPEKELKAFAKVNLKANEERVVTFELNKKALSYYNPDKKIWEYEPGEFEILVGSSSRDIKLKEILEIK